MGSGSNIHQSQENRPTGTRRRLTTSRVGVSRNQQRAASVDTPPSIPRKHDAEPTDGVINDSACVSTDG